jgi:hypothetical protein
VTTQTINLDTRRGIAAQKATEIRRQLSNVQADQAGLKLRQEELEAQLIAAPSSTWVEAGEKARYLITLLAATPAARDPRRKTLIANVLEDLRRLAEDRDDTTAN